MNVPARALLVSPFRGNVAAAVDGLLALHFPDAVTVLDMTYGDGKFWHPQMPRGLELTTLDINPAKRADVIGDFRALPFPDRSCDVAAFAPPYMVDTSERSIMGGRFGHFKDRAELELAVRPSTARQPRQRQSVVLVTASSSAPARARSRRAGRPPA